MVENVFEYAVRNKIRFPFKGLVSVEDLWDLSLENLDIIFKTLNKQVKQMNEESLLDTKTAEDVELDVKIAIVKHIFKVKTDEKNARIAERDRRQQRQQILEIMANRKNEALQNKSDEELQKMLDDLG